MSRPGTRGATARLARDALAAAVEAQHKSFALLVTGADARSLRVVSRGVRASVCGASLAYVARFFAVESVGSRDALVLGKMSKEHQTMALATLASSGAGVGLVGRKLIVYGGNLSTGNMGDAVLLINGSTVNFASDFENNSNPFQAGAYSCSASGTKVCYFFGGADRFGRPTAAVQRARAIGDGLQWTNFPPGSGGPSPRLGATLVFFDADMYLFGGATGLDGQAHGLGLAEPGPYRLSPSETFVSWASVVCTGTAPCARLHHAATASSTGTMIILGGIADLAGQSPLGDVYCLDIERSAWSAAGTFAPRFGLAVASLGGQILVFGGCTRDGSLANDFQLGAPRPDGSYAWSALGVAPAPPPQFDGTLLVTGQTGSVYDLALFGGYAEGSGRFSGRISAARVDSPQNATPTFEIWRGKFRVPPRHA